MGFSCLGRCSPSLCDIIPNIWCKSTFPETESCPRMETMICDLPDDLLLRNLLLIPTNDSVATAILSKRWCYVWTMLPELDFKDEGSQSIGWFSERSLLLHKALILDSLSVELGPHCPVYVDVGKWVENAVSHRVFVLVFSLLWTSKPTSFPKCLYTCETLVTLILSNEILVDLSFPACLPTLLTLCLLYVVYKDDDSLDRLLSSSPDLVSLLVQRREAENLTVFIVNVSYLERFYYASTEPKDNDGSLEIDFPTLTELCLMNIREDYCLMENNMPCLDEAFIEFVVYPEKKFMRSLSFVIHLHLSFTKSMIACCNAISFSRLIELYFNLDVYVDWLEPFIILLQNSPNLKTLTILTAYGVPHLLGTNQVLFLDAYRLI